MSRRHKSTSRKMHGDPAYDSKLIELLVNRVLKNGKKALAYKIVYTSMMQLNEKTNEPSPLQALNKAIFRIHPKAEVKPRRVGGGTFQIPYKVKTKRGVILAIRWLLMAARKRSGKSMTQRLTIELFDAYNRTGTVRKRRNDTHRSAEANKAFKNFRYRK